MHACCASSCVLGTATGRCWHAGIRELSPDTFALSLSLSLLFLLYLYPFPLSSLCIHQVDTYILYIYMYTENRCCGCRQVRPTRWDLPNRNNGRWADRSDTSPCFLRFSPFFFRHLQTGPPGWPPREIEFNPLVCVKKKIPRSSVFYFKIYFFSRVPWTALFVSHTWWDFFL